MGLRDIHLKKAYSSDSDDVLHDFYIPVLQESVQYDRLAGFFSSTSLAVASKGISGLIGNNGNMRLIVSPRLRKEDVDAIVGSDYVPETLVEKTMLHELKDIEDKLAKDHVSALGWMVARSRLEIRVAVVYDALGRLLNYEQIESRGIFHQKVGILRDQDGNTVTFSGSVNETATGWLSNIEEFKVFRSWELPEGEYVQTDEDKFSRFWKNGSKGVKVMGVPAAVQRKLLEIAPRDVGDLQLLRGYRKFRRPKVKLYEHQREAVDRWVGNGMIGILEMATGTGKTFAALGCLEEAARTSKRLVAIITCPYQHLVRQWQREVDKFGIPCDNPIIADSTNSRWRREMADSLISVYLRESNLSVVITTHSTFCCEDFSRIVEDNSGDLDVLLIADEVHGLGAQGRRRGLTNSYAKRLGLSATPRRWYDTPGTKILYDYFGDVVYEFTLEEAVTRINPDTGKTFLSPYRYLPRFLSLTNEELDEFVSKTKLIVRRYFKTKGEEERDECLERLLFERANIVKNAQRKLEVLNEKLDDPQCAKWTIVYCSPQQIETVMRLVNDKGITAHQFTMEEGTVPEEKYGGQSERDFLLQKFSEGRYQILVAMKCLDEGVDVPPTRTAILMASSGNPREYVQRIGRILRRHPGKHEAVIFDLVVAPSFGSLPEEFEEIERTIWEHEKKRCLEIAKSAVNNAEIITIIFSI